jgi:DNA-binding transcriptional MerR regulator/methylmalonyl-CoA mutase cobalamin-binding subunit
MSYRIKRVAHLTGINPATLRAWERRYNLIAPGRTDSGYRVYSDEDVALLARIKHLTDEGLTIGEAIARVRRACAPLSPDAPAPDLAEVGLQLREALLQLDRQGALTAYERLAHLAPERRAEEVLLPAMREVFDLREQGEAEVAQASFAAGFVREKLAAMISEIDTGVAPGPEAVCAGIPGEPHEFGLLACALRLAAGGWKALYLGPDLPFDELRRVAAERKPAMLCTSLVARHEAREVRELAERLRSLAPRGTTVVIAGGGLPERVEPVDGVRFAHDLADIFSPA